MDPDSMLSRVVRCQGPPSHKGSVGWIKDVSLVLFSNCFQTVRPRTQLFELVTKAEATWEDSVYPRPFSRDQADAARTRIASAAGS
jgi:hypothetical protein